MGAQDVWMVIARHKSSRGPALAIPPPSTPWLPGMRSSCCLDIDGLASARVSPLSCGTILDLEDGEAGEADFVAVLEVLRRQRHQIAHHCFGQFFR
jgi:hypothetical protein